MLRRWRPHGAVYGRFRCASSTGKGSQGPPNTSSSPAAREEERGCEEMIVFTVFIVVASRLKVYHLDVRINMTRYSMLLTTFCYMFKNIVWIHLAFFIRSGKCKVAVLCIHTMCCKCKMLYTAPETNSELPNELR